MRNTGKIIALSGKRGCGKSTLAKTIVRMLEERGISAECFSLASVLKKYVSDAYGIPFDWTNRQEMKAERLFQKNFPKIPEDGMTLRQLLQNEGARLRENDPAFTVHGIPSTDSVLIVDDVRMPTEDEAMKRRCAFRVRIEPYPGYEVSDADITETALDSVGDWDLICYPKYGEEELEEIGKTIVSEFTLSAYASDPILSRRHNRKRSDVRLVLFYQ